MNLFESTRYLLWYGEKVISGDEPTEEEHERFIAARKVSLWTAHNVLRIKPEDHEYVPGQPYKEM